MTWTLQGEFIEYEATFRHIDGLGDPRTSLFENPPVIHDMIHVVRIDQPSDDLLPDFLVNDVPDLDEALPETVWSSDGTTLPVIRILSGTFDAPLSGDHLQIQLTTDPAPAGWV